MKFMVFEEITTRYIIEADNEDDVYSGEGKILSQKDVHGEITSVEEYKE